MAPQEKKNTVIIKRDGNVEQFTSDKIRKAITKAYNAGGINNQVMEIDEIVRNLAFNRYKHNTAAKRGAGELPAVLDELGECVSDREDVEEAYDYTELVADINAFLSTLPTKKRNIFVRRYWYADSVSEIAARYNMSCFAVSMMLTRLREKLRNYLTERGYEL